MSDISELKQRIDQAATGLDEAENMRRDRNSTLGDTLAKVEGRFNARLLELGYLRQRIGELESANQGLTETIDTFSPTRAWTSVDLPTLGRPTTATNPDRKLIPDRSRAPTSL